MIEFLKQNWGYILGALLSPITVYMCKERGNKMFKTRKEMQSLIDISRKHLADAEERTAIITKRYKELKAKNETTEHNAEVLLQTNDKLIRVLNEVADRVACNQYNKPEQCIEIIRDLTRKYQTPIR